MRIRPRTPPRLLDDRALEMCLQGARKLLRDVPFRIQGNEEFFDYLRAHGCAISGEQVRFPEAVIDDTLARIGAAKRRTRDAGEAPEMASSPLGLFTHGQAFHICDTPTNALRPATTADLAAWCRLVDGLGDVRRSHPTFIPTEVHRGAADFCTFATIILNSREPHRVSVYSARMVRFFAEAQAVAQGSREAAKRNPVFAAKCWITSPFMISRESIEIAMEARRLLGMPISFGQLTVPGASSPVTVAGSLVQDTAESLAACAMSLALDGGFTHVSQPGAVVDFRHVTHRGSGPDFLLRRIARADMEEHLFGLRPPISLHGVAAQTVSPQSLYEKAQVATTSVLMGADEIGIGSLAYSDVGSPVQLVLDYEMGRELRHLLRDVSFDDEHLGMQDILRTIPRGAAFMDTDQTARYFREETWLPALIDPRPPLAWLQSPTDMIVRARARAIDLETTAENQCPLSAERRRSIEALVRDAIREAETVPRGGDR